MRSLVEISELPDDALLDRTEVAAMLQLVPDSISRLERTDATFPRGIRLAAYSVRYELGALRRWIQGRPREPLPKQVTHLNKTRAAKKARPSKSVA